MTDKQFLIVPPPGLIPDPSAPPEPTPSSVEHRDSLIAVPPTVLDSATVKVAAPLPPPSMPVEQVNEDTITIAATASWRLDLPYSLPSISVTGAAVLGRNPSPVPGHPDASLVSVADPAKSVSKTHALVELDGVDLYLTDLDSTNGSVAVTPLGVSTTAVPGARVKIVDGSAISLGEFTITASRR